MSKYDFVRVMADYGSSGLWVKFDAPDEMFRHGMAVPDDIGISQELADKLSLWIDKYDTLENDEESVKKFDDEGRQLARLVKNELGKSVTVVYSPESNPKADEPIS